MNIGGQVKKLRKRLHMTQKEFAGRIADNSYIGQVERGYKYPSVKFLVRLADTYSVPVSYFFLDGTTEQAERLNRQLDIGLLMEARVRHWLEEYLPELAEDFREEVLAAVEGVLKEVRKS